MFNGEKLRDIIEREGRTRKWVADQCGVQARTLIFYINGRQKPSKPVSKLLALALNCDEQEFYSSPDAIEA